jgi:hypothetical protein
MAETSPLDNVDRDHLIHPPDAIAKFIKRMNKRQFFGIDQRRTARYLVAETVLVRPVDLEFCPVGPPFLVVLRDLSKKGLGLVHTAPIVTRYLAAALKTADESDGDYLTIVGEVIRCRQINESMYDIGCRFLTRL